MYFEHFSVTKTKSSKSGIRSHSTVLCFYNSENKNLLKPQVIFPNWLNKQAYCLLTSYRHCLWVETIVIWDSESLQMLIFPIVNLLHECEKRWLVIFEKIRVVSLPEVMNSTFPFIRNSVQWIPLSGTIGISRYIIKQNETFSSCGGSCSPESAKMIPFQIC